MSEIQSRKDEPSVPAEKPAEREVSAKSWSKEKIRQVPENLRDALKTAADVAISRIMAKVASKEWMPTDAKTYRTEIIAVLKETDAKLPANHPLKDTTDLIVENFLTPEDRGAEFVRAMLEKGYSVAKEGGKLTAGPKEFDTGMQALRSMLGFSIDLAKKRPEKIAGIMDEIKKVPEAANILSRFPDLETVLVKILPDIAKNVDKQAFLSAFDAFAKEIRTPALSLLSGKEMGDAERGDVAMKMAHESAKLVNSALTKDTVKSWIEGIASLSAIKNNPVASKLVELVRRPELSDDDRYALVKKANEGIVLFTKNPPDEAELQRYANSAAELVSSLSSKLPSQLVSESVAGMFEWGGKGLKITSKYELAMLIAENWQKIPEALRRMAKGELNGVRDVIRFIVDERILETNLEMNKGELIERLKKAVDLNLASFSDSLRRKLATEVVAGSGKPKPEETPQRLADALSNKVLAEMAATFFWPDRPARITKELLADRTSKAAAAAIDSMPGNTVKVSGMDVPKNALKTAVTSVEFRLFAADAFAKLAGEAGNVGASMDKLASIVAEIMKDPLGNKYVGERTRAFAIDAFYAMPASDIAETVYGNLDSSGLAKYLKKPDRTLAFDKRDVTEMVNVLRDGEILPKETLAKVLSKENLTPPVNVLKILSDILKSLSKEQLTLLLDKVTAKRPDGSESLLKKGLSIERKGNGRPMTKEDVLSIAGLVLETAGKTDAESRKAVFEAVWANPKTAEYGLSFFSVFGKERVLKLVSDHPETFAEIFSGKLDPKRDAEKILPLAVDVLYASDAVSDAKMVMETKKAFPGMAKFFDIEVFWGKAADHLDRLRRAVPKEKALAFVNAHSADFVSLASNFDKAKAAKLWAELLLSVDRGNLATMADPSKLSGAERLVAEKLPQIRDVLEGFRNETATGPDGRTVSRLDALIEAGTAASEGKLNPERARFLAWEAFELFSRLIPAMGDWKMPENGDDTPEMAKKFKKEFLSNNLGFVIGQALPYLFWRPTEKIVATYFADGGNKEAFVKTVSATLTAKS